MIKQYALTLIGLGFFLTCLGLGGGICPPCIFVVSEPSTIKFCTGIDHQSLSSNMEKICIELMTS